VLAGLFVTPAVTAIKDALASAKIEGALAVVGNAKLATAIGEAHDVIPVGLSARVELATDEHWQDTLRDWSRVVRDGGVIIIVDRGHPHEASRRALCGGLSEIEQRLAGRAVITSGLVSHLT
jgi:hypothetical protein